MFQKHCGVRGGLLRNKYDLGHVGSQHLRGGGVHLNQRQQQRQCYSSGTGTGTGTGTGHRHQHRQQLNVAFPYALIALFALCARCSLCARPDRALARRSTRLRRATPSPSPPSLTLATPSFPLCHFEPTVAELVALALSWLPFRYLNSLLHLG